MRIGHKIGLGFACGGLLLLLTAVAGYIGLDRIAVTLEELTGPVWLAADAAMEASIKVEDEILAVRDILDNGASKTRDRVLDEAREGSADCFARLDRSGILTREHSLAVAEGYGEFRGLTDSLLASHERFRAAKEAFEAQTRDFLEISTTIEEIGDSAVETLEESPDQALSWNSGLRQKWEAADGGMEASIAFLTRLHDMSRVFSHQIDVAEGRRLVAASFELQGERARSMFAGGLFEGPCGLPGHQGQSLSAAYLASLAENGRLGKDYLDACEAYRKLMVEQKKEADSLLELLWTVETRCDEAMDAKSAEVASIRDGVQTMILVSAIGALLVATGIGFFLTRRIVSRIEHLRGVVGKLSGGDLDADAELGGRDEISQMGEDLQRVLEGLREAFAAHQVSWSDLARDRREIRRYKPMIESAATPIALADPDGGLVYANPAARESLTLLGLPGEVEGRHLAQLFPVFADADLSAPDRSSRKEVVEIGAEVVEIRLEPIRDADGDYIGPMCVWKRITAALEQRRKIQTMAENERRAAAELAARAEMLRESVHEVATGNLDFDPSLAGDDACARISSSLVELIEQLDGNLSTIAGTARDLQTSADEIGSLAHDMSRVANATRGQAEDVSRNSTAVNDGIASVASATEELSASIREIAHNASDAASRAIEARRIAQEADGTVTKLGESSRRIGEVVQLITSIAEQTNLLALNATIEAARAGDSGKGFAVVAHEVKELASETARATEEISAQIVSLQGDASRSIKAMSDIRQVIDQVSEFQSAIASAVEEQAATASEMSHGVTTAAKGSSSIARAIAELAAAIGSLDEKADQAGRSSEGLLDLSRDLGTLLAHFKVRSGSMAAVPA
ncbi:MAG: HAMP domain-containing protein [Planctomycetes bacterium]|nr:HAMP domain-containing protein [Planctomycetota bacterium]